MNEIIIKDDNIDLSGNNLDRKGDQRSFDLRQCIDESIALAVPACEGKQLEMLLLIAPDVPTEITGNAVWLRQVLVCLIENALKSTPAGEVKITVEAPSSGQVILFKIKDSGIGIPGNQVEQLFLSGETEPMPPVDGSSQYKLTLPLCKSQVEMAGEKFWVANDGVPGKGSTLNFSMTAINPVWLPRSFPVKKLEGKHLLLVDSHLSTRQVLTQMAQELGLVVHRAASASDALEMVQGGVNVDLAMVDTKLRDLDGLRLIRDLKSIHSFQHVPVILMLPYGQSSGLFEGSLVTTWISKPLRLEALGELLMGTVSMDCAVGSALLDGAKGPVQTLQILLAEDNPTNQKVIQFLIKRLGYSLDLVSAGDEAVATVKLKKYDVVLMDVHMPVMDGLEATRVIRKTLDLAYQPRIIALTADDIEGDRNRYLTAGMDGFLAKPVEIEKLSEILNRWSPLAPLQPEEQNPPVLKMLTTTDPLPLHPISAELEKVNGTINESVLYEYIELLGSTGPKSLAALLEIFINSYPTYMSTMQTALDHADLKELRRAAHSIKSSSASMGAQRLSDLCRELEHKVAAALENGAGKDEYLAYRKDVALIQKEFQQVAETLNLFGQKLIR